MTNNLSFLDSIFQELLTAKHSNYSEQCINLYLDQHQFIIEDLGHIRNQHQQKLKCTLIKHRLNTRESKENQPRTNLFSHRQNNSHKHKSKIHQHTQYLQQNINNKCIIYLHGLGSSRLESLSIVQHLPKNYCICMFDMSGSGKSQGEYVTYGMKEHQDIEPVIQYLHKKKHIKDFVIWGRSMGAVATLLYAIENYSMSTNLSERSLLSRNSSIRNSIDYSNSMGRSKSICQFEDNLIKAIVLDSPFCRFRDIAKQMAGRHLILPNFLVQTALDYLEQSFDRILQPIGKHYNPFRINFDKEIHLNIPLIFMYSEKDEVIPSSQCTQIIRNIKTKFQKILINDCTHNQARPEHILIDIFKKIDKYTRQNEYENKKLATSVSRNLTISQSSQRKRGIFVYTLSKQKNTRQTLENHRSLLKFHQTIEINKEFQKNVSPPKGYSSQIRSGVLACKQRGLGKEINTIETIENEGKPLRPFMTIDTHVNSFIHSKLRGIKDNQTKSKMLRSKKLNVQARKEFKLSHLKYLE